MIFNSLLIDDLYQICDDLYQICDDLYQLYADDDQDIIDEALYYFKANVFFKSYEVKVSRYLSMHYTVSNHMGIPLQGPADRVLIYLTLYISECLKKLQRVSVSIFKSRPVTVFNFCSVS